ncbi:MAG: DinB family protein [Gemmatimonadota bacterium]
MARQRCLHILDDVAARRDALLARLAAQPAASLTHKDPPDGWSPLEIVEHLVLAERSVFRDLDALADLEEAPQRLRGRLLRLLVVVILRGPFRVRVPTRSMVPSGSWSLEECGLEWRRNHARLRAYAESLPEAGFQRAIFAHPVSGPLTVSQAIHLMSVHLGTHERQLDRLL